MQEPAITIPVRAPAGCARFRLAHLRSAACALLLLGSPVAPAQPFDARLDGATAQPPNASSATGGARIVLDAVPDTLSIELGFAGLSSASTAARIHCCALAPNAAPVALQSPGLDGFPRGVSAGSHALLLDLRDPASFDAAFLAGHGGAPASAAAALRSGVAAGGAYVEIASSSFPAGEIRGYLAPALVLFADGLETPSAFTSLLRCDSPADAEFVDATPGAALALNGTAIGIADLRVNGASVPLSPGHGFTASVAGRHGVQFIELSGIDGAGATRTRLCAVLGAVRSIPEGTRFDEALLFRFEPTGFQKLTSRLPAWFGTALQPIVATALAAGNPLLEAGCGAVGSCVREVRYLSLAITVDSVEFAVVNSATLRVTAQLDARLGLRVRTQQGFSVTTHDGEVRFDNARVVPDVQFGVDAGSGSPSVTLAAAGFQPGTTTATFPTLDPQFTPEVIQVATDALVPRLTTAAGNGSADLFIGLIAGRTLALPPSDFAVAPLHDGAAVPIAFAQRSSMLLKDGGLHIGTGLHVATPPPDATGRIALPPALVPPMRAADAWSAMHVGVVNQVLQALWRAGAFDGRIDAAAAFGAPAGTTLALDLRLAPLVTGVDPAGTAALDVGALDLVVDHPALPPSLRVTAGARVRARASLLAGDLVFGDFAIDERHASTGIVALDAASKPTLDALLDALFLRIGDVALNDTLPALPASVITIPESLAPYGFTPGTRLIGNEQPAYTPEYLFLDGVVGE